MSERASERKPEPGDTYLDGRTERKIREVGHQYDDGGWEVRLDNGVYYDCYWNGEVWQYWPHEDGEADE